ncbi:hypothetical protein M3Y98_00695600 [Aphelenchoides besseyi]|nr:hypothetical protein M3Y98_00695600 [Aphelenchoides besseyi]
MKLSSSSNGPNDVVEMSSMLQTILENMRRVSYHSDIPDNKKVEIKKFLARQGDLYLWLQQYEARVIDSEDTENFEMLEEERQRMNEELREVNGWLKEHLEFQDAKPEKLIQITPTNSAKLNELLTDFFRSNPVLMPSKLIEMIGKLDEKEHTFICVLTAQISLHIRGERFDRWVKETLLDNQVPQSEEPGPTIELISKVFVDEKESEKPENSQKEGSQNWRTESEKQEGIYDCDQSEYSDDIEDVSAEESDETDVIYDGEWERKETTKRRARDKLSTFSVFSSVNSKKLKPSVETITLSDSENDCIIIDN